MNGIFFELLQVALGSRDRLSRVPNAEEWSALYDEAERQAILGALLEGLQRCMVHDSRLMVNLPQELKLQWIGMVQMMEAEYKVHCERASELTSRFRAGGFKSCILKGIGLAQYYPHPERRQCGDIDIWVDGKREDVLAWLRAQCEVGYSTWHHTDAIFFEDVPVEVHFRPSWIYNPFQYRKLSRFFKKEKDAQMAEREVGFSYPTTEFNAVFALTHAFHHLLEEEVGMRHIVDYYYVLKEIAGRGSTDSPTARIEGDGDILLQTSSILHQIGLDKFAAAMMWVLKEACGAEDELLFCELDEKEGRFLLSEIMAAGNFGFNCVGEELKHNSLKRYWVMGRHYPGQVLWMISFKVRNKVWMTIHK